DLRRKSRRVGRSRIPEKLSHRYCHGEPCAGRASGRSYPTRSGPHTRLVMIRPGAIARFALVLIATLATATQARAQTGESAKPGPAPGQPIDTQYTRKIKEYTTESFFL